MLEIMIEDNRWETAGLDGLADRAASALFDHLGLEQDRFEVAVLACDDARITVLNGDFREKPTPTNVLSWPSEDLAAEDDGAAPYVPEPLDDEHHLGDIAISYDTCAAEAAAANKPFSAHVTHLVIHGLLHLLGYDHIRDADATLMEGIEAAVLGKLGLPNPYIEEKEPTGLSTGKD